MEQFNQSDIPYPNSNIEALHSEHALEHSAGHTKAEATIKEWARTLKPYGKLSLEVPDLEECCRLFLAAEDREAKLGERFGPRDWYKYTIYGIQDICNDPFPEGQYHRTGFTEKSITRLLEKYNFRVDSLVKTNKYGTPSLEIKATQIKPIRICFVTYEDNINPSMRLIGNLNKRFNESGECMSRISHKIDPKSSEWFVLFTANNAHCQQIQKIHNCGNKVAVHLSEYIESIHNNLESLNFADLVICVSDALAEKIRTLINTEVIVFEDAHE